MTSFGYTLSSEEHPPRALVEQAARAEAAGLDFVSISDHFHPWIGEQGHSPFVWSVLGAIAERTERLDVAVGVTCPTTRIHPAIVAQAAATASLLLEGRFTLGVSGFGPESVSLAAAIGDGYWGSAPDRELVDRYESEGGTGPRYSQINVCWAADEGSARKTVHQVWPNRGIAGQLSQDLPTWVHFEQAATMVTEDMAVEGVPCGPDVEPVLEQVRLHLDAGYDHLYFHQIGPDQEGFLRFWTDELAPALDADRQPATAATTAGGR